MNKNILRFLLSAVLLMCCMVANAAGTKPSKGNGSTGDPYQIATKEHLLWFADYVNQGNLTACAILTADITVNTGVLDSEGNINSGTFETWTPIGNWGDGSGYNGFAGEFNGGGHTVSGLYFSDDTRSAVGLFGMTNNSGEVTACIHDVGIKDSYFRGKSHVAGICGDLANGKIENCWNAATVQSTEGTTGGIAGSCWTHSSVSGCYNIGKVAEGSNCGGICGSVAKNPNVTYSVSNCVSLEGKCSKAYNLYTDDTHKEYAQIHNVTIQNATAFGDGTVCNLLGGHSAEFVNDGYIPTATTEGRYGHWHCRLCGKDFLDEACTTPTTDAALTVPVAKNNEIWYTTTDNRKISPHKTDVFGATYNDANNVYERGLGKISFDADVTSIGSYAFAYDCSSLKSITVPNSVTAIGEGAFFRCSSLVGIKIPDSVTSMNEGAFWECYSLPVENNIRYADRFLVEVTDKTLSAYSIKEGTRWIGLIAFENCTNLTGIEIPSSVTDIGRYAFSMCSNLQTIVIPGSVKIMGGGVFNECNSINNVTIGDGAYIGKNAFQNCGATITVNGSLSGTGEYAFYGCTGLKSVSIEGGSVGQRAFEKCTNLTSVSCKDCSISDYAFSNCENLIEVTLQDGVTAIGEYAFRECEKLPSISIVCGSMGKGAFKDCTALTSISVKSGHIGEGAFSGCTELISATLYEGLTSIDQWAFADCSKLPSITIPGSVNYAGAYLFHQCWNLKTVTIEDGAYIGKSAFINCGATITVNGSLSGAGEYAFYGSTGLKSVSIRGGNIGAEAFRGCTGLTTVTLLKGVAGIAQKAFYGCSALKDITVEWTEAEKIPSIDKNVFDGVDQAKATLHVPSYTTSIYKAKEVWSSFNIFENINFIVTKTDGTKVEQKLKDGDEVTIDESEDDIKSLVVTEKLTNVSMTYIRNFANADKWQGWYVPFDVSVTDMAQAGFEVAKIYGILLDNSGNTVLAFLKMNAGTVKANTPYVVRPKESGKVTLTTSKTTIRPSEDTKFTIDSAEDTYTIGGIYEQTTTPGNWYAINKDGRFQKMGEGVGLRPFRVWMTIDSREDNPYATKSGMNMMVISKGQIYTINGKNYLAQ